MKTTTHRIGNIEVRIEGDDALAGLTRGLLVVTGWLARATVAVLTVVVVAGAIFWGAIFGIGKDS